MSETENWSWNPWPTFANTSLASAIKELHKSLRIWTLNVFPLTDALWNWSSNQARVGIAASEAARVAASREMSRKLENPVLLLSLTNSRKLSTRLQQQNEQKRADWVSTILIDGILVKLWRRQLIVDLDEHCSSNCKQQFWNYLTNVGRMHERVFSSILLLHWSNDHEDSQRTFWKPTLRLAKVHGAKCLNVSNTRNGTIIGVWEKLLDVAVLWLAMDFVHYPNKLSKVKYVSTSRRWFLQRFKHFSCIQGPWAIVKHQKRE